MSIRIRRATERDLDLVTWVMLAASRSHLDRGIWEYLNATDETATLSFLRRLATSDTVQMFHWSLFLIAELDGEPGAAMCAYDSSTQGFDVVLPQCWPPRSRSTSTPKIPSTSGAPPRCSAASSATLPALPGRDG